MELPKGCEWTQGGSVSTRHYLYPTSVTEPYPASLTATLKRDANTPILLLYGSSPDVPAHPSRGCVPGGGPPGGGSESGGSRSSGGSKGKWGNDGGGEDLLSRPVSLPKVPASLPNHAFAGLHLQAPSGSAAVTVVTMSAFLQGHDARLIPAPTSHKKLV